MSGFSGAAHCEFSSLPAFSQKLNEIVDGSDTTMDLPKVNIPVNLEVQRFCGILGLDPLYLGNEGNLVCFVAENIAFSTHIIRIFNSIKYQANM